MSLPALEPFTGTDTTTPPNANWTNKQGNVEIASNQACGFHASDNYAWGVWNADTPNADQYSQVVIKSAAIEVAPVIRATGSSGSMSGYLIFGRNDLLRLYRVDNGAFSVIQDYSGVVADNDVLKVAAETSTLKGYKNGVQVGTNQTDATYGSAGQFGVVLRTNPTHGAGGKLDDWEGGNVGAAATQVPFQPWYQTAPVVAQ